MNRSSMRTGRVKPNRNVYLHSGDIMKIGLIGLGRMGTGLAMNLLKAGHELTVYNRTPAKAQSLVALGARAATPPPCFPRRSTRCMAA
jgi:shikimate 5-dehydrogenase